MLFCPDCGNMVYPKIAPAVIVGITDGDKILMTKYAGREYKKYSLVAGFCEIGEAAEDTVRREVMEEVGLKVKNIRYYKSQPWGFDSNLLMGFFADLDGVNEITRDETELAVAEWIERKDTVGMNDGISLTREMIDVFCNNNVRKSVTFP
jgi:NAD+ diphosphatase